jgi:pimeloyl-ACP methyl ester carboxylesterase
MAVFQAADGVEIAFDGIGEGPPTVMVHGFAANRQQAWRANDWYEALIDAGREALALDLRGHGGSAKPRDPEFYAIPRMADDVVGLLDRCELKRADIIAHSLGARLLLDLLVRRPERIRTATLIGVGETLLRPPRDPGPMIAAFEADDPMSVDDETARSFRAFADSTGADREALVAVLRAPRTPVDVEALKGVEVPVLVVGAGTDPFAGAPDPLADAIPGARAVTIRGTTHHSVLADPRTKVAVFEALGLPPPGGGSRW